MWSGVKGFSFRRRVGHVFKGVHRFAHRRRRFSPSVRSQGHIGCVVVVSLQFQRLKLRCCCESCRLWLRSPTSPRLPFVCWFDSWFSEQVCSSSCEWVELSSSPLCRLHSVLQLSVA